MGLLSATPSLVSFCSGKLRSVTFRVPPEVTGAAIPWLLPWFALVGSIQKLKTCFLAILGLISFPAKAVSSFGFHSVNL